MANNSKIEWTQATWNPITGCDKVSQGCKNCYAEIMHRRLMKMHTRKYNKPFLGDVSFHEDDLGIPLKRKKPTIYFVNSMSDLWHPYVLFEWIESIFFVMAESQQHTFQILTKRPEIAIDFYQWLKKRNREWWDARPWPLPNVWIGTSVEDQKTADERIPHLIKIPAAVRFLSCEPLLGEIVLSWNQNGFKVDEKGANLHWCIVGGESGHKARPMHPDWVRSLRDQCKAAGIPFFFKQWGQWGPYEKARALITPEQSLGVFKSIHVYHNGKVEENPLYTDVDSELCEWMFKLGKHAAGNVLDGKTHLNYPA